MEKVSAVSDGKKNEKAKRKFAKRRPANECRINQKLFIIDDKVEDCSMKESSKESLATELPSLDHMLPDSVSPPCSKNGEVIKSSSHQSEVIKSVNEENVQSGANSTIGLMNNEDLNSTSPVYLPRTTEMEYSESPQQQVEDIGINFYYDGDDTFFKGPMFSKLNEYQLAYVFAYSDIWEDINKLHNKVEEEKAKDKDLHYTSVNWPCRTPSGLPKREPYAAKDSYPVLCYHCGCLLHLSVDCDIKCKIERLIHAIEKSMDWAYPSFAAAFRQEKLKDSYSLDVGHFRYKNSILEAEIMTMKSEIKQYTVLNGEMNRLFGSRSNYAGGTIFRPIWRNLQQEELIRPKFKQSRFDCEKFTLDEKKQRTLEEQYSKSLYYKHENFFLRKSHLSNKNFLFRIKNSVDVQMKKIKNEIKTECENIILKLESKNEVSLANCVRDGFRRATEGGKMLEYKNFYNRLAYFKENSN